jgi:hypothetical protein
MSFKKSLINMFNTNRKIILLALIVAVSIGIWLVYVNTHDDGIVEGRVVNQNGDPVAGAQVLLQRKGYDILDQPVVTQTDEDGYFFYKDEVMLEFVISAEKNGYSFPSERINYHRYFPDQNFKIPEPLVLVKQ